MIFDKLESAGHQLTMVQGLIAGCTTYFCESCGALIQIRDGECILFHVPSWNVSTVNYCPPEPWNDKDDWCRQRREYVELQKKLNRLQAEDYERLKKI